MPDPTPHASPLADAARLRAAAGRWLRDNAQPAAVSAVLGAVLGYLLNVLLTHLVFRGPGAFDGSSGLFSSLARSAVFCGICSSVAFGLIGYRLSVGSERFGQALRALPGNLGRLFRHDGQHARVHLLWGAAVSFMLMQIVTPLLGAALAVGLMTALPSLVGRALANLLARAFSQGAHALGPTRAIPLDRSLAMAVGMLGSALALVTGLVIVGAGMKLVLAAACAIAAIALARGTPPTTGAKVLLVAGLAALLAQGVFDPPLALAADRPIPGEMGRPCVLQDCGESHHGSVWLCGLIGALFAGFAAPWGLAIGHVAGRTGDAWADAGTAGETTAVAPVVPPMAPPRPDPPGRTDPAFEPDAPPPRAQPEPPVPPRFEPDGRADDARRRGPTQAERADLARLNQEVTDPQLYARLQTLAARSREDAPFDPAELDAIAAEQAILAAERSRTIDSDQAAATARWHAAIEQRDAQDAQRAAERRRIDDLERIGRGLISDVGDPARRAALEKFLERHTREGATAEDAERALQALRKQTFEADQQRAIGAQEVAATEAQALADAQHFAEQVRDSAARANRLLARLDPTGVADRVVRAQRLLESAIQGAAESGAGGAIGRSLAATADYVTLGAGTTVYDGVRQGEDAGTIIGSYADNVRNHYDPTRVLGHLGSAATRLAEGGGLDALGETVEAAFGARDYYQRVKRAGQRLAHRAEAPPATSHAPLEADSPAASREGRPPSGDRFDRARQHAEDLQKAAEMAEARAGARHYEAEQAAKAAAAARERMLRSRTDAVRSRSPEEAERFRRAAADAKAADRDARGATLDADLAREQAQLARMNADVGRERWLNNDPRRALERAKQNAFDAAQRTNEGREVREQADETHRRALDAARANPSDESLRADLERARSRASTALAQQRHAQAEELAAVQREHRAQALVDRRDARDQAVWERTTEALRQHYQITAPAPPSTGKIVNDRTEVERQWILAHPEKPKVLMRVVDPRSGVEVAVNPDAVERSGGSLVYPPRMPGRFEHDPVTGTDTVRHPRAIGPGLAVKAGTEDLRELPSPEGARGFFDRETRTGYALPIRGTVAHEAGHGLESPAWLKDVGHAPMLIEGANEYLTQKFGQDTNARFGDRGRVYGEPTKVGAALDRISGGNLHQAVHNGRMDILHDAIGRRMQAAGDPAAAGARKLAEVAGLMKNRQYDAALRELNKL